jgi:Zn-dependent peptidase ImmA (M78 family)
MIVALIVNGKAEKALELLSEHYDVNVPKLRVGLPKGHRKNTFGCYTVKNETISVLNSDALKEPFIILHEFYHHTRIGLDTKHRGTERYANEFAKEFIQAYKALARETLGND